MQTDTNNIAILIPAYNEAKTIRQIVSKLLQYSNNVVVIDDGSSDNTIQQLQGLAITLLQNQHNRGKGATLLHGFRYLHAQKNLQAIITIDADNQHDPQDIPRFIAAHKTYPQHLIIGARTISTHQAPSYRLFGNKVADFFTAWAAGQPIMDSQSGYRLYPIQLLERCLHKVAHAQQFAFESGILIDGVRHGFLPISLPIESRYPDDARKSHYHPLRDTLRIIKLVGWKIISRGFNLPGLIRSLVKRPTIIS